ncbi:MAG: 4-(cytidine 5'-diphospho)-2-C-methyl-D-erythritol kinase, partial [Caulobacterales bacterium]|nr:4-(cytidine 5'-diphospho)-2-C-methyl-D-erythritol kinase [Caulobacterales bacterium]
MIREFAPAKVNLTLHVVGRRPDGYHLLDSLVVFAKTGDKLRFEPADEFSLTVGGRFAGNLGAGSDNLVARAARLLAHHADLKPRARIHLDKRMPVAAGMG